MYWPLRIASAVVPRLPRAISEQGAILVGIVMWLLLGRLRRRATANLQHVPELAADQVRLRRAVRGVFRHTALNYVDFLRGPSLSDAELLGGWTITGQDVFEALLSQGRGLIILAAHFGNFERAISRTGTMGYPMVTPAEHLRPERLFQLFCRIRMHHRMRLVPADQRDALRELLATLKRGELVPMAADRHVIGATRLVPLFGALAPLPVGPFALALRSGAPVVAGLSWREDLRHSGGEFRALTLPEAAGDAHAGATRTIPRGRDEAAIDALQRQYVAVLERHVRAHPEQWVSALWPIWEPIDRQQ